jgi:hypothetical protein
VLLAIIDPGSGCEPGAQAVLWQIILIVEASGRGGKPPAYLENPRADFLRDSALK